jgi:predicted enzyme related to lactoylglutathione lyase
MGAFFKTAVGPDYGHIMCGVPCPGLTAGCIWGMVLAPQEHDRLHPAIDPAVYFNTEEENMGNRFETHGAFSWAELMTRDPEGSKKFYKQLLDWEMDEMPMQDGTKYTVLKAGGEAVAGIMPMPGRVPEMVPNYWATYITVKDVDAVARKAEELGAEMVVPPTDVPGVGRFSTFQDPQGAVINVMQYTGK